jgi:hypothetical protein
MSLEMFVKSDRLHDPVIVHEERRQDESDFEQIRCPRCGWQPSAHSRWCCDCLFTPEPVFDSCGTVWNTFATRGRCPGCSHQWQWTTCLSCHQASLHRDWYERSDRA